MWYAIISYISRPYLSKSWAKVGCDDTHGNRMGLALHPVFLFSAEIQVRSPKKLIIFIFRNIYLQDQSIRRTFNIILETKSLIAALEKIVKTTSAKVCVWLTANTVWPLSIQTLSNFTELCIVAIKYPMLEKACNCHGLINTETSSFCVRLFRILLQNTA